MALRTICGPCYWGDHEHHHRVVQAPPEGGVGGSVCVCNGECTDGRFFAKDKTTEEIVDFLTPQTDLHPEWYVWVCPYCGEQYRGPGSHSVAGDDAATHCLHAHPGERGVVQPRLVRVKVVAAEPFIPREVPHDSPPEPA